MERTVSFNVSGGNLPDKFSVKLTMVLNFDGVSADELVDMLIKSSSPTVLYQTTCRMSKTVGELMILAAKPFKLHIRDIYAKTVSASQTRETFREQPFDVYVETMERDFSATTEHERVVLYATIHNMEVKQVQELWDDLHKE